MSPGWLRYDLEAAPVTPHLYRLLHETTGRVLATGAATDTFFVHTPDGIRLRCATGPEAADRTADAAWRDALAAAERRGWLRAWRPVTHEPEQAGLGGPGAMASAHGVFTADSVAWLGYHSDAERPAPTVARWAMSVLMIRALLAAAGHTGWEHADLWDRILHPGGGRPGSRQPARSTRTAPGAPIGTAVRRLAIAVRAGWDDPDLLRDRLSADQRLLLDTYETAVRSATVGWLAAPVTGAVRRHGVALSVLFHWNRSAMPAHHRHLLATALADAALPRVALAA
jgi:thiopeptide-type bacteriocin biosynthesis protein